MHCGERSEARWRERACDLKNPVTIAVPVRFRFLSIQSFIGSERR